MGILYRGNVFKQCFSYVQKMKEILNKKGYFVIYALVGAVSGVLLNTLILRSPLPELFPAYSESFSGRLFSTDIVTGIFLYCILSPVTEELLFRRLVYDLLYKSLGFPAAALISSLLFAAYHMNMIQGIYAFSMGMLICVLYHRDHRMGVPIAMHIGANLAVWLLANRL